MTKTLADMLSERPVNRENVDPLKDRMIGSMDYAGNRYTTTIQTLINLKRSLDISRPVSGDDLARLRHGIK